MSYVRLAGDGTSLTLVETSDPAENVNADVAGVRLCRIEKASWKAKRGVPLDDAPAFDSDDCVSGRRGSSGTWTFDLRKRDDRSARAGFALVPDDADDVPISTFQVTFSARS
jgi:hypothetical protein